jgi:hypothetical protein
MKRDEVTGCGFEARRRRAIHRGLGYLRRIASNPRHAARHGSGLLYCCAFMASTAADPELRRGARMVALRGWTFWRLIWRGTRHLETADDVAELVHGHFAVERLGLRVPRKRAWLRREAARFAPEDFLGWDPLDGLPRRLRESCGCGWPNPRGGTRCGNAQCASVLPVQSRHRAWCLALTASYCGERFGVCLGRRYGEVLQLLPQIPAYPAPSRGIGGFYDAVYAITHVVYTLNDYGRLRLEPEWLPREYTFLARHLENALSLDDPDMVGEFLDTLRAFGVPEEHPAIRWAMEYLLERQNPDGSWGPADRGHDYFRFHSTWAALDGLRDFAWQGTGISFPELLPRLRKWACQR